MNVLLKKEYALLSAVAISAISAFLLLFLMICFGFLPVKTREGSIFIGLVIPTVISLYLFPKLCQRILIPRRKMSFINDKKRRKVFWGLGCFLILYSIAFRKEFDSMWSMFLIIFQYLMVSVGEEFTYRELILDVLKKKYNTRIAIMISAFMFSFILHINESWITNLLIRFPMGIILGYIATKTCSIAYTVGLHTIYNLIVLIL